MDIATAGQGIEKVGFHNGTSIGNPKHTQSTELTCSLAAIVTF
jgi:hypothetical protein